MKRRLTIHVKVDVCVDEPCDDESELQLGRPNRTAQLTKDILLLFQLF